MNLDKEFAGLWELIRYLNAMGAKIEADGYKPDQMDDYQPQLGLEHEPTLPSAPKYEMRKDVRNFKKPYSTLDNCAIADLLRAGWLFEDIGELLGRTGKGIKGQYHNHIKDNL